MAPSHRFLRPARSSGEISPLSLVSDSLSSPPPADEASPSVLQLPSGEVVWLMAGIYASAHAAQQSALRSGLEEASASEETASVKEKAGREARGELRRARAERKAARKKRAVAETFLGGRLRRTRLSRHQAAAVLAGVGIGEIALNASAAIGQGDVVWLSILAFLGVGAATIGIGMSAALIREAVDQAGYQTESVPPEAAAAGIGHFFVPARRLRAKWLVSGSTLIFSMVILAVAVGALRETGGFTPLFGIFTAITIIGAGAIAYVNADPVADLFENLDARLCRLDSRIETLCAVVDEHVAASKAAANARAAAVREARAQWDLVLAQGLLNLPPHLVGHAGPGRLVPISPEEYEAGTWREAITNRMHRDHEEKNDNKLAPFGRVALPQTQTTDNNSSVPNS